MCSYFVVHRSACALKNKLLWQFIGVKQNSLLQVKHVKKLRGSPKFWTHCHCHLNNVLSSLFSVIAEVLYSLVEKKTSTDEISTLTLRYTLSVAALRVKKLVCIMYLHLKW